MKPHKIKDSYRPDIDGLRALAILAVIGFHAFPAWVPGGFVGVDIFFVISGYLITSVILSDLIVGRFSFIDFYCHRIRRIFPALTVVMISTLAFGFFFLWPDEFGQLAKHALGGAGFIVNYMLENETGYFSGNADTKPLLHLWTLGVEEQFYILWPAMLWAAWKFKRHTGLIIVAVIMCSFTANMWCASYNSIADFYSPFSRFWELIVGGFIAWFHQQPKTWKVPRLFSEIGSGLGLTFITMAVGTFNRTMEYPGWLALSPVLGAAFVVAAGKNTVVNRTVLSNRPAVYIGLISYPLYLWHWPLLSVSRILTGEGPPRSLRIAMIALAFALAIATYLFVEQPIRREAITKKTIGLLVASMAAVAIFSGAVYMCKGIPDRFAAFGYAENAVSSERMIAQWEDDVRFHTCHLQDPGEAWQATLCTEKQQPLLLLWGDSHAASLYPGLKNLQKSYNFGIAQLTQSSCPPLFDLPEINERKNCNQINKRILFQAQQLKPAVILLNSAWLRPGYPIKRDEIVVRIKQAVAKIKEAVPTAKIIVAGPAPRWIAPLPSIYRHELTFDRNVPAARSFKYVDMNIRGLDAILGDQMAKAGIDYLSLQEPLCSLSGCRTRFTDDLSSLVSLDEEHLTTQGSDFVIDFYAQQLSKDLGVAQ